MPTPRRLPDSLGHAFTVAEALDAGVSPARMRARDLDRPFHGVRTRRRVSSAPHPATAQGDDRDRFAAARTAVAERARAYAPRLRNGQFFSHSTAAVLWGAPIDVDPDAPIHLSAVRPARAPRSTGVTGHELGDGTTASTVHHGMPLATPDSAWVQLGSLPVADLVAIGDYFVRCWRQGYRRPGAGTPPLTDRGRLRLALESARRPGAARLRAALERIREDSWSPNESRTRCVLHDAGLPEPMLNLDVFDPRDGFLGCVDLAYPEFKVAVEYNGELHGAQYARDIERIERLRAHGWEVVQVTWPMLYLHPDALVARVRTLLRSRGCTAA